ncbi:MAG: cob(I)yrinic acid a,c-diamide adenosyltransferase [Candidatus Dormibacter sp.]
MSIVTRHGDGGETSLLYGGRVPKDDLHTEAYGALDEAISALGLARALCTDSALAGRILDMQRDLFTVGAELATATTDRDLLAKHFATVRPSMVEALDIEVSDLEGRVQLPKGFVIPGGTPVAAALDMGRTFVRRAERRAVTLARAGGLANAEVLRYLNRCSDLLFMLARQAEGEAVVAK